MMSQPERTSLDQEITEITRLIDEYRSKITDGTSSADEFMSITDMEKALGTLRNETNNIFTDIQSKLINQIDQAELLRKKNRLPAPKRKSENTEQR